MRLLEAIIDANHRAVAGDKTAGLRPAEFESELPVVALTCIDPRLNPLIPEVLGVPEERFIWLRNAGNIITGPVSSTTRSLALACAVKGGKEIIIIGHTDCQVRKTTVLELMERFRALGVERHLLPDNLNEFFGMFASERANVIKAVDIVRQSPLIGPKIPVQGLLVDIETGKVEWVVNGYQSLDTVAGRLNTALASAGQTVDALKALTDFEVGGIKFPETKIGEAVTQAADWLSAKMRELESKRAPTTDQPAVPPKIPLVRASAAAWRRERQRAKADAGPAPASPEPGRPKLRFRKGPQ